MRNGIRASRLLRAAAAIVLLLCAAAPAARAAPEDCAAGRHRYTETRRVPPTAMEDGEADFLCGVCGHGYTEILFATNHLWGEWVTDRQPTCTQPGERRRTCARAQPHDEYADIPALGHNYSESIVKPDCEKQGVKTYACTRCNDRYTRRTGPAGHNYKQIDTQEPSCLEPGASTFVCANNAAHTYREAIPAIGDHDFGEWSVASPAGEGAEGREIRECARCGLEESNALEALPVTAAPPTTAPPETPAEPPSTVPVLDIVLVGANVVSLGFLALLLIPYILCLVYIKKRRGAIERRDELRKEVEARYGFK